MDPYLRARFEQAEYERRFVQDQRDAALLAAPVYQQYANQAAHGAPSALDEIAKLPMPPRRGADGKIISRPQAPTPTEVLEAPVERIETPSVPDPDIATLARLVADLQQQMARLSEAVEKITPAPAGILAVRR
jgi:hypothetical protein